MQLQLRAAERVGVTIGNFDGVHLGHQALFEQVDTDLRVLLTFAPHPRRVLSRRPGARLALDARYWTVTSQRRKIQLAERAGFDLFVLLRFTPSFARLSPRQFVERYLHQALHAKLVVVGYDWSFGKERAGSVETLHEGRAVIVRAAVGEEFGFETRIVEPVCIGELRVSTTLVKDALTSGDLPRLQSLLGRRFEIEGVVRHGDKRGRDLGFPTLNLKPREQLLPPDGVYAALVHIDERVYPSAVNLGVRPVFETAGERLLEAYLIDEVGLDLYGKRIRVEFVEKVRDERAFSSVEALIAAMQDDVAAIRNILAAL